jgi:hypothetical protein
VGLAVFGVASLIGGLATVLGVRFTAMGVSRCSVQGCSS